MSEEPGWSYTERKKQVRDALSFLKSTGLDPGYLAHIPEPEPRGRTSGVDGSGLKVRKDEVLEVLRDVPGYEGVLRKDYAMCLRLGLIFGELKEVSAVPSASVTKQKRMRIPVEKSGGGV
ncbi:hypothetical protein BDQ17DRAFT_1417434 [Cyathus striatus]|nr:hypothetical protein BDQ17DRAFT_1417434 [Cyathus striatus]